MLPDGHPDAWDADTADAHLPADYRRRYMPAGSHLVITPMMRELIDGIPSAMNRGAAICVSGPSGSGKTTALVALKSVADVNVAMADIPRSTTPKQQWEIITTAITGIEATGTAHQMQRTAREYLIAVPTLLIVDEAQYIGLPALLQLRWLWSQNFPRFAIILAGADLQQHLDAEPSIKSRIDRRIRLEARSNARMVQLVTAQHPQAAASDPAVLTLIDDTHCRGSWREWSNVLFTIRNDMGHTGPITIDIAETVIRIISGTKPTFVTARKRP